MSQAGHRGIARFDDINAERVRLADRSVGDAIRDGNEWTVIFLGQKRTTAYLSNNDAMVVLGAAGDDTQKEIEKDPLTLGRTCDKNDSPLY